MLFARMKFGKWNLKSYFCGVKVIERAVELTIRQCDYGISVGMNDYEIPKFFIVYTDIFKLIIINAR